MLLIVMFGRSIMMQYFMIESFGCCEIQEGIAIKYEEDFYMQYDKFHDLRDLLGCGKRGESPPHRD